MNKFLCFIFSVYFSSLTLLSPTETQEKNITVPQDDGVHLVLDSTRYKEMPRNFRKSNDKINTTLYKNINTKGLKNLNISGSAQFSGFSLPKVIKAIDHPNIISVDLRQESHGFINGLPVSWMGIKNNANEGLSREEVIKVTQERLNSIVIGVPIAFFNHPDIKVVPKVVMDEKQLTSNNDVGYEFIPVTDGKIPTEEMMDFFISFVKNQPKNSWLHFHCKEGIGRTTTFMILYDMMKNYSVATEEEIINRQIALVGFDKDHSASFLNKNRVKLFKLFYDYCKTQGPQFNTSFSEYLKGI
ncbi:MAG: hypothetical protein ACI33K_00290, partial [Clostridiaceae bacterium]